MMFGLHALRRSAVTLPVAALLLVLSLGADVTVARAAAPAAPALTAPADDPGSTGPSVDDPEFRWTASAGASSYELQFSQSVAFTNAESITTPLTRYRPVSTLQQDEYHWRVRAISALGTSAWSPVSTFHREWLDPAPAGDPDGAGSLLPARPRIITPVSGGVLPADQLAISWTPVRRASYYVVDISSDASFTDPKKGLTCRTPHTSFTPYAGGVYVDTPARMFGPCGMTQTGSFVQPNTTYYLRVRAVDETPDTKIITTLWSNNVRPGAAPGSAPTTSFTVGAVTGAPTPAGAPAVPNLTTSPDTDAPLLSWRPVTGAQAYKVGLARDSSFNTPLLDPDPTMDTRTEMFAVTSTAQFVLNQTLLNNTGSGPFYWFVLPCTTFVGGVASGCVGSDQAINQSGFFATFRKLAKPVTGLVGDVDTARVVSLSWADQQITSPEGGGMQFYELEVSDAGGAVVDDVKTDNTSYIPASGTYPAGTYRFRVRVIDASGTPQDWSAFASFTVPGSPAGGGITPITQFSQGGSVKPGLQLHGTNLVAFGRGTELAGTFTTAALTVLAGARVTIQSQAASASRWTNLGAVTTESNGEFRVVVRPKVNSRYRAVAVQTASTPKMTSVPVKVAVSPRVRLRAGSKRAALGQTVLFAGTVTPTKARRAVAVECARKGRWVTRARGTLTRRGAFALRVRVTSRKSALCRVAVKANASYAAAVSREVYVSVR